jgi:hypothetical protein
MWIYFGTKLHTTWKNLPFRSDAVQLMSVFELLIREVWGKALPYTIGSIACRKTIGQVLRGHPLDSAGPRKTGGASVHHQYCILKNIGFTAETNVTQRHLFEQEFFIPFPQRFATTKSNLTESVL